MRGLIIALIASFLLATYQILWKLGVASDNLLNLYSVIGFILYIIGGLITWYALQLEDLSVIIPVLGISYPIITILAVFILGESLTYLRLIAIGLIFIGVVLVGGKK